MRGKYRQQELKKEQTAGEGERGRERKEIAKKTISKEEETGKR